MSVPNTNTFGLDAVRSELGLSYPTSLQTCFNNAIDSCFDATYKGSKDRLSNFRNYSSTITTSLSGSVLGHIYWNSNTSWSDARDTSIGIVDLLDPVKVGVKQTVDTWTVRRAFCQFDLSSLSGKTIVSANIYWGVRLNTGGNSVVICRGTQGASLSGSNYSAFTSDVLCPSTSYIYQASCGSNNLYYLYGVVGSAGLTVIQDYFGSTLKIVLMSFNDYADYEPGSGSELNTDLFKTGEVLSGCTALPRIQITYR